MQFGYPHNDTSRPERPSRTAGLNRLTTDEAVLAARRSAFARSIPVSSDETLQFLCLQAAAVGAKNILEIGTAVGASGMALLFACPAARLTTIEKNAEFAAEAARNFAAAGLAGRVRLIEGDAAEQLGRLEGGYDFIFLDGPKAQYVKWLPRLKELLSGGGLLVADDVLLYGWVSGERPVPAKRRMLAEHVREYLEAALNDGQLVSYVADIGDGLCISLKKADNES